ncbi:MAG TPA: dipeptidase [Saprospiraceae bacterium]|nr:dipeptidase [Saprospiraceae bacterium]HPN68409.1 dipeptidase [Saprospiraceae bacterium]
MKFTNLILFVLLLCVIGCSKKLSKQSEEQVLRTKAQTLAHQYIITDGHVDLPYRLAIKNFRFTKEFIGIPIETKDGDFDFKRAKAGGLDVPFMSIYIPSSYQVTGGAKAYADSLIDMVEKIAAELPDYYKTVKSPAEAEAVVAAGKIALPMGMENGAPIEKDIKNVAYFKKRGISYITLTHGKDNQICDSSYDTTATWKGLSPFGMEVVAEMNIQGIMIDVSHISDKTFWQVMELSRVPVIASHSSARNFTPGFQRNMSDEMIVEMGKKGGVIQVNFGSTFLDGSLKPNWDKFDKLLSDKNLKESDPEAKKLMMEFEAKNGSLFSDVEKVADHIDLIVKLAGIDHVGLGSDFDGVGDSLPAGLKDVSQYPNLIYVLLKRGYTDEQIEKICYKNVWRVWNQALNHANG